jgi:hypothetical protein
MNGASAMLEAVRYGDVSVVKRLLSEDPVLVRGHSRKPQDTAPLTAEHDHKDVAKVLLHAVPT